MTRPAGVAVGFVSKIVREWQNCLHSEKYQGGKTEWKKLGRLIILQTSLPLRLFEIELVMKDSFVRSRGCGLVEYFESGRKQRVQGTCWY